MLVAFVAYAFGQRYLPHDRPAAQIEAEAIRLTKAEWRQIWFLIAVIALTIPAEIAYPMVWNIGIVWVDQHVNLATALGSIAPSSFSSIDSIGAILVAPALLALWGWQARRGSEPAGVTKIGIGTALVGLAALVLAFASLGATAPDSVGIGWALGGYLLMGLAWMYYWPTLLALVSKSAPRAVTSRMMGIAFLSPFVGHTLMGWVGSFYDKMNPSTFWAMDAGIALAGAVIILALRKRLTRELAPQS